AAEMGAIDLVRLVDIVWTNDRALEILEQIILKAKEHDLGKLAAPRFKIGIDALRARRVLPIVRDLVAIGQEQRIAGVHAEFFNVRRLSPERRRFYRLECQLQASAASPDLTVHY